MLRSLPESQGVGLILTILSPCFGQIGLEFCVRQGLVHLAQAAIALTRATLDHVWSTDGFDAETKAN